MIQEDKDLLRRDLCCRLPYGVVIQEKCIENDKAFLPHAEDNKLVNIDVHEDLVITSGGSRYYIEDFKPYLFPLSSMTEEQREELVSKHLGYYQIFEGVGRRFFFEKGYEIYDWFNKNHFDYRGLIEKSLALDATNLEIYK